MRKNENEERLVELFNECINDAWNDEKMRKYCKNKMSNIVQLSDGSIISFEKPTIETNFCFGYGFCGVSTSEDFEGADKMREHAKKNAEYFIEQNLKNITETVEALGKILYNESTDACYIVNRYGSQKNDTLKDFVIVRWSNSEYYENNPAFKKIVFGDIRQIIDGLYKQRELFSKRLLAYLKRYGLTKINSWTYLVD